MKFVNWIILFIKLTSGTYIEDYHNVTYIQWLDFSGLNIARVEIEKILYEETEFITCPGNIFGEEDG